MDPVPILVFISVLVLVFILILVFVLVAITITISVTVSVTVLILQLICPQGLVLLLAGLFHGPCPFHLHGTLTKATRHARAALSTRAIPAAAATTTAATTTAITAATSTATTVATAATGHVNQRLIIRSDKHMRWHCPSNQQQTRKDGHHDLYCSG